MKNPDKLQAFRKSSPAPRLLLLVVLGELSPSSAGWNECATGGSSAPQIGVGTKESPLWPVRWLTGWVSTAAGNACLGPGPRIWLPAS